MVKQEFFSMRLTLGGEQTSVSNTVSKVLQILPGLSKEDVGQRLVGTRWAVKVRLLLSCGHSWGSPWLRTVLGAGGGSFGSHRECCAHSVFRLRSERSRKEELNLEAQTEVRIQVAEVLFQELL